MEFQIGQFVSQQREAVEMGGRDREHRRDRDRRRDRSRERDRDRDSHRDREHKRHREHRDHRGDKDERRSYGSERHYSRSRDRHTPSPEPTGYEDSSGYLRDEDRYPGYVADYSPVHNDNMASSYGDTDDRIYDNYRGRHSSSRDKIVTKAAERWITDNATNTIILKTLTQETDEKDIRAQLMLSETPVKEVRLVKDKMTGASRGFAFVEFQSVGDAQQWMEQNQGRLYLLNKYYVNMYYSMPKRESVIDRNSSTHSQSDRIPTNVNPLMGVVGDWICSKCGVHNFKRRDHCFKCNISREESDRGKEGDGYDQVGHNPCNTLILRGLDALTNEETLTAAIIKITTLAMKNIRVCRNETSGISQGYAFLEMNSIAESTQVLETVNKLTGAFEVDGKAVLVNYAKNTFSTVMATLNSQYYNGDYSQFQQQGYYGEDGQYYDGAQYYGQYDYAQYYNADGTPAAQSSAGGSTQTDSTNAAAAVAQAAISKAQAAKAIQKKQETMQKELIKKIKDKEKLANMTPEERMKHEAQQWAEHTDGPDGTEYAQYPVPDVSTYQYDETSGYYYDASTGLYYDPNSQYYYNSTTGEFMYWDGEKRTYLPAPSEQQAQLEEAKNDHDSSKNKECKKDKVKVAKKIAKDMEKWAKTLNSQKDIQREAFKKMFQPVGAQQQTVKKEAATADAGFAILERSKKEDLKMMPPPPTPGGSTNSAASPALVASYGDNDSDNDENVEDDGVLQPKSNGVLDESKLADYTKMACLLCKRQFLNEEALQRHQQLSDLHKKNLEELRKSKGSSNETANQEIDSIAMTIQYRDRAKERRAKYGAPAPPVPKKSPNFSIPFEQTVSNKRALGSENKGNKLLQKMGWNEGQGLGKKSQGMITPIQASKRTQGAGLGTLGASVDIEDSDTYKEACKKVMMARFNDMD